MKLCRRLGLPSFLFIKLLRLAGDNQMYLRKSNQRALMNVPNSTIWDPVHCHTMTNELAKLSAESRVLGVNLPSRKISLAPTARIGDTMLETKCMLKTAFWTTFDGVNRPSFCGDRATKLQGSHPSYPFLLRQEATLEISVNPKNVDP